MIAAARSGDDDEGPAFPLLPGETEADKWRRIMAGSPPRKDRAGTPIEGPVTDGNLAAAYSAPPHPVPTATHTAHAAASVLLAHTVKLPIPAPQSPPPPLSTESPFDPRRHAPTLRLPRASGTPRLPDANSRPGEAARATRRSLAVASAILSAAAIATIAIVHLRDSGTASPTAEAPTTAIGPGSTRPAPPPSPPSPSPAPMAPIAHQLTTAPADHQIAAQTAPTPSVPPNPPLLVHFSPPRPAPVKPPATAAARATERGEEIP